MRKAAMITIALAIVSMFMAGSLNAEVTITIVPNNFVLDYDGSKVVVHTNIPFGDAINDSITLSSNAGEIEPVGFKSDDRGNLVVKFSAEDLATIVSPPSATLTLTGEFTVGGTFSATDAIRVK